ncbi:ABC-type bacteriocin/lantibiotic exporter, contains an N-terminal double-glycine peptidase domain [Anaerovirgula multivorans]|uniref:ABC-type bacteriocin/lantibiotic exporter, contains an N-terminal double-glycine peptidase domain n=1 Tax=Anaerovirgula multivorans TaxID=312168 RepID=A0A239KJU9_9FIRM|nr:ABC transporter ATP-binding protein [Anaerovirgula multivorans]SNT17879.1 ABC-type bacteriocin/lantibiotic exporter, contains an N-terminal double-glycine peptidase domain [Anaerovirgula multivorans]
MQNIFRHIGQFKYKLILLYIGIILISLISLFQPLLFSIFIDGIVDQVRYLRIIKIISLITIINLLSIIFKYVIGINEKKLYNKINYSYLVSLIKHIQKIPYSNFLKHDPIYISNKIKEDSTKVMSFIVNQLPSVLMNLGQIVFALFYLIKLDSLFIIVISVFVSFYLLLYFIIKNPLFEKYYSLRESSDRFEESLVYQFTTMKLVRIKALYFESLNTLNSKFNLMYDSNISYTKLSHLFNSLDNIISTLFTVTIMVIFGRKVYLGEITLGQFTAIQIYFTMILNALKYFIAFFKTYQEFKVSYIRVNEFLRIEKEYNGNEILESIDSISLSDLRFTYDDLNRENECFDFCNLSLKFSKNNIYLIKGRNGSGKSTLLNIATGLFNTEIQGGHVKYNNKDLKYLDMYDTRKRFIGYIDQIAYSSSDLVLDYLANDKYLKYNLEDKEDKDCKLKNYNKLNKIVNERIRELKLDKYFSYEENILTKKISELSGGERQKINIIKEFLKKPDVIYFDEPNTALDTQSIEDLKLLLKDFKKNFIFIIVTHDKHFDNIADHIIEIKETAKRTS